MSFRSRRVLTIVLCSSISAFIACGGEPPNKEILQAEAAIATAQTEGADTFAHDEFKAAQEALTHAHEAVTARDYRLALSHALDSRERALNAAAQASAGTAAAQSAADTAISVATAAVAAAKSALQAGEAAHAPARALASVQTTLATATTDLQEARTARGAKNFQAASAAAHAATEQLAAIAEDLNAMTPAARRKR